MGKSKSRSIVEQINFLTSELERVRADLERLREEYRQHWHDVGDFFGYGQATFGPMEREESKT